MFEFDELFQIAYKRERAIARRLTKLTALSAHAALTQTLEKAAGAVSLADLVDARRMEQAAARNAVQCRNEDRAAARAARLARALKPAARDASAWHAWFDGSAHPNPGKIGIGGLLESPTGDVIRISAAGGHGDSCKAEYLALIAVLEAALLQQPAPASIVIHGDSQVVIQDVLGDPARSAPALSAHAAQARGLIAQLSDVRLQWIPRHRNGVADALSQSAIRGAGHDHASSRTSVTGVSPNASLNT